MRRPASGVMAKTVSSWLFVLIASCTKVAFGRCFRLGRRWSASPRTHGACNDNNLKKYQPRRLHSNRFLAVAAHVGASTSSLRSGISSLEAQERTNRT